MPSSATFGLGRSTFSQIRPLSETDDILLVFLNHAGGWVVFVFFVAGTVHVQRMVGNRYITNR